MPDEERIADAVTPSRVAHNTLLNILGLAVPLAVAFFVMPIAARHLGPARFGLLGLAWAITEYLILFDLGLGRAIVRFVADALNRNAQDLNETLSVAIATQIVAGLLGGAAFVLVAPALTHLAFKVPSALSDEAIAMFRVVGLSLPVILVMSLLRGVLEGAQRFDLSNAIKMSSSAASMVIPAIGAYHGASLPTILWWMLLARAIACGLYLVAVRSVLPSFGWTAPKHWARLRELLAFGGWVLVSNIVSPFLVYFDRFALGAIAGVAAVGFYTAPYEGVTRLLLIAASLGASLLPALASLESRDERGRVTQLEASSVRTLIVVMAPLLALVLAFAPDLLHLWMGPAYAAEASLALRILAVGVFVNALAQPPIVTLYAVNRPDLPAKFHVAELILHIPLTIFLIRRFGIAGAAAAWTTRVSLDFCLLLVASARCTGSSVAEVAGGRLLRAAPAVLGLGGALWGTAMLVHLSPGLATLLTVVTLCAFLILSWTWILRDIERDAGVRLITGYRRRARLLST